MRLCPKDLVMTASPTDEFLQPVGYPVQQVDTDDNMQEESTENDYIFQKNFAHGYENKRRRNLKIRWPNFPAV